MPDVIREKLERRKEGKRKVDGKLKGGGSMGIVGNSVLQKVGT